MKTLLKKPTILQMVIGLLFSISKSLISKKKKVAIPQRIGKYQLASDVKKENLFREYLIGIYQYRGEKVFIKTWTGFVKDFQYYELINEYFINRALYRKLNSNGYIKVPKIVSYIERERSFSVIYEFVKGKILSSFSRKKQVKIVSQVLSAFNRLSSPFTNKDGRCVPRQTLKYYILALTFLSSLTILSNPRDFKVIFLGYIYFLKGAKCVQKNNLRIAHRDLSLHNIIIKDKYIFLIDCARVILTYEGYDIAYISINPRLKNIAQEIARDFNYSANTFLENYILINQARSFGNPMGFKNFYLEELKRRYG